MAPTSSRRNSIPEAATENTKGKITDLPSDSKKHGIFQYRPKRLKDRSSKSCSTTSEVGSASSTSTTLSKVVSKETSKSDCKEAPRAGMIPADGALPLLAGKKLDLSALPFEPVFRAGILIIITSPSGVHSLGLCDGETKEAARPKKRLQEWIM